MDLTRAFSRLKRRERELLWLAYAQGSSHEEIGADARAQDRQHQAAAVPARRRKLAELLRGARGGEGSNA